MKKYFILILFLGAINCQSQTITTGAGGGSLPNGLAAISTLFNFGGMTVDSAGNIYIADQRYNRVFKVDAATGLLNAIAGTGAYGSGNAIWDGGVATAARLNGPSKVILDAVGNLYIIDENNYRVRKINKATGIITTVAGNGILGNSGDGGPATAASLHYILSIAVDNGGNLYISDNYSYLVRKVSAATGIITTVAGNGLNTFAGDGGQATAASFDNGPGSIAVDAVGNLYIANNSRIRKVNAATGIITTVIGNGNYGYSGDGGPASAAALEAVGSMAFYSNGDMYLACGSRVRKVSAASGIITTVAGNGIVASTGDGGAATAAALYYARQVALDGTGNFYISDFNYQIRKVSSSTGIINTIVGKGTSLPVGDSGLATTANLNLPAGVSLDTMGNLYIADSYNSRVRKVALATGIISTVAGCDTATTNGDGRLATRASVSPHGIFVNKAGDIFISEDFRIRKITASTGIISTVAGGTYGFSGDGGPAIAAGLSVDVDLTLDIAGNIYVADYGNNRVRKVSAASGIITTIAGNGINGFSGDGGAATAAALSRPGRVAIDMQGNLLIADEGNNRLRKVASGTGIITTVAGNGTNGFSGDGGFAINAALNAPIGIKVDNAGNIYFADAGNHRIRMVKAATGIITTVAGNGTEDFSGDNGAANTASFYYPIDVALDNTGNVYIADYYNNRIRKVTPANTLPLQLLSFNTHLQKDNVLLQWQTSSEVNTSHFTIQRSTNGTEFTTIGNVAAKGDGDYSYLDDLSTINNQPSTIYYRLQMVDKDGSFTYSKMVAVSLITHNSSFIIYPNPVTQTLYAQIKGTATEKVTIQITDMQGRVLQQQQVQLHAGNTAVSLNTAALGKGNYTLVVRGTQVQQQQFVKE